MSRSIQPPAPTHHFTLSLRDRHLRVFLNDIMIREANAFGPEGVDEVFVGVMGCSPKGGEVEARFKAFTIREGVRD